MKKGIPKIGVMLLALGLVALTGCTTITSSKSADTITIVGKNFTEQEMLVNLTGVLIEKKTGLKVNMKSYLGGTDVVLNAMKNGNADLYVEYTGTGLVNILGQKAINDPEKAYSTVKSEFLNKYQLEWLQPIGFNNTYALAVTQETAKKYNLKKVSDLAKAANNLTLGTEQEFLERDDGLRGLEKTYGLKFKDVKSMDPGLKYSALAGGKVDVVDGFSTDGQLIKHNLVLLEDDKKFFPPYYAAPVVRSETLKQHPEVGEALRQLAGKINERQMAELNAQVEVDKKRPRTVAEDFLKQQGIIE